MPITRSPLPSRLERTEPTVRLRLGLLAAAILVLGRFGVGLAVPGYEGFAVALIAGLIGILLTGIWWLFFSHVPWTERLFAVAVMILVTAAAWRLTHPSMGLMWAISFGVPILCLALIAWAAVCRRLASAPRRAALAATIVLACLPWTLVRLQGLTGDHGFQFAWRWTESPEELLLEREFESFEAHHRTLPRTTTGRVWPGFRGVGRNGVVAGIRISTDWSTSPPVELWRRPIGPGWSSFAVADGLLYTQEQRGDEELVSCYRTATGDLVWSHSEPVRFYESMGGAGPRATPTLHGDRVYALGATGILNALDSGDGSLAWSRDLVADSGSRLPIWGFASSPLIVDGLVLVAADGQLVAYDIESGEPRWFGPQGGASYSSPQLVRIDGELQVLWLNGAGATGMKASDGQVLWQHDWSGQPMVQPAMVDDYSLLIAAGEGHGVRRLEVNRDATGWRADTRWTSNRLKPNFNDFVIHHGHAYGFDGNILACIDLETGQRQWKGGRYGQGQLLLLVDQSLLLVLSEQGDLALVEATPKRFNELARKSALEGKTWNHPVLMGDFLLIRNSQEMTAYRLTLL